MKAKRKPAKDKSPYYTPVHPLIRLRQRLMDGSVPTEWLRYSHKKELIPKDVLRLIEIAEKVHTGTAQLNCLVAGKHALLLSDVTKSFKACRGLIHSIGQLLKAKPDLITEIRDRLIERCNAVLSNGRYDGD